jgi:anaerobic selenocysteine-containing dehydrogenase
VRVDSYLGNGLTEDDVDRWVPSATVLHSNGDGLDIAVKDGRIAGVRGRADDRVNHGRLGPKDLFGWQANHSPDRLTHPVVRRDGELVETDWDTAMQAIVERTKALLDEQGPSAIGQRPAVPGGVLHPRTDRPRRPGHQPPGRQHPVVHGDSRGCTEGVVHERRTAGLVHRR